MMDMPAGHALVVGGTGMLRGVCTSLAGAGWTVSVVARRHALLASLAAAASPGAVNPLPVDYHDREMLAARIRSARAAHGAFSLAVCWIHSSAPEALPLVAELVGTTRSPCRLFHVVGSAAADPTAGGRMEPVEGVLYRRVVLGFVIEGRARRWLHDDEIVRGVLDAIAHDREETVVGTVSPWSARPE